MIPVLDGRMPGMSLEDAVSGPRPTPPQCHQTLSATVGESLLPARPNGKLCCIPVTPYRPDRLGALLRTKLIEAGLSRRFDLSRRRGAGKEGVNTGEQAGESSRALERADVEGDGREGRGETGRGVALHDRRDDIAILPDTASSLPLSKMGDVDCRRVTAKAKAAAACCKSGRFGFAAVDARGPGRQAERRRQLPK